MTTRRYGRRIAAAAALLALAACGGHSSTVAGAGASSQEIAMQAWLAGLYDIRPDILASYDPAGSGAGREMFITGAVDFAGTDAHLDDEEYAAAVERCEGGDVLELPLYISPIAVAYHLPGLEIDHLQLSPHTIAAMFDGRIERWDDPAIAETNPGVDLPDLPVVPVNRSDDSGTTENFTAYLAEAAGDVWTYGAVETWPIEGTQSGAQTSGMIDVVSGAEGTIGYADASRAGDLGTIAVGVGEEYVPFSPEAAAAVVDASPAAEDATDLRLTVDLARDTTEAGTYPIVLISYSVACSTYDNEQDAANVKAFLEYVASPEGQERASRPDVAGSAPISDELREKVHAALDRITVAG